MADTTGVTPVTGGDATPERPVPDGFTTREWGSATVYACEHCPFDTLYYELAKQHAQYGHFEVQDPAYQSLPGNEVPADGRPVLVQKDAAALPGSDAPVTPPTIPDQPQPPTKASSKDTTGETITSGPVKE